MQLQAGETYSSQSRLDQTTYGDNSEQARYEERRVNMIVDLMQLAEPVRKSQEPRWQQSYEYYYSFERDFKLKQKHQSKIFVPRTFEVIETKTPQIVMAILQQSPVFSVNPETTATVEQAKVCESLLHWQMRQIKNLAKTFTLWIKDSHLYGGSVVKTGWAYQQGVVPQRVQAPPMMDWAGRQVMMDQQIIQVPVVEQDNPTFVNCDMGEIYPDPTASCIEDAKFIIHRMIKPYHEIRALGEIGFYKNVEKIDRQGGVAHWVGEFANRRYSTQNIPDPYRLQSNIYDYVELLECWWVDPSDPYTRKWKTTVANRRCLLQDIPLGDLYWHNRFPFILLNNIPMTKEFWGISECDVIHMMQRELNSLRNMRMDNINAVNKAYWVANRNAGINQERMSRLAPGDVLWTNDINGVRAERPPSVEASAGMSEQSVNSDIQRATGQSDMITGTPTRSQFRNATTATLVEQAAKTRLGLNALLAVEQVKRVAEDFLALDYQYLSPETVISVLGADGMKYKANVTPDMIPRNPEVYATLGAEIQGNADVKKQMLLQLSDLMANIPGFNLTDWARDLAKDFGKKDIDKYFVGEDYVVQTEEVMAQFGLGNGQRPGVSKFKQMQTDINPMQGNQFSGNVGEMQEGTGG